MTITSLTIKASHIAIGSELTSGQTLNTNSHTLSQKLRAVGVINTAHLIVPDDEQLILKALDFCVEQNDWIFIYGGLGPTTDDFTRNVVAKWTEKELVLDASAWENIQNILKSRNYPIREFQKQQAYFPKGYTIMENSLGTAHGFCILNHQHSFKDLKNPDRKKSVNIFVLPGPPKEVNSIWNNFLDSYIKKETQTINAWTTGYWNTIGLGESEVANQVEKLLEKYKKSFNENFPNHSQIPEFEIGYRVHLPFVEVKFSNFKNDLIFFKQLIQNIDDQLKPILAYQEVYPIPDFMKNFLKEFDLIIINDEFTQFSIANDIAKWIDSTKQTMLINKTDYDDTGKKIFYLNVVRHESDQLQFTIQTQLKNIKNSNSNDQNNTFTYQKTISLTDVLKWPIERQILFIKELIYFSLYKK